MVVFTQYMGGVYYISFKSNPDKYFWVQRLFINGRAAFKELNTDTIHYVDEIGTLDDFDVDLFFELRFIKGEGLLPAKGYETDEDIMAHIYDTQYELIKYLNKIRSPEK